MKKVIPLLVVLAIAAYFATTASPKTTSIVTCTGPIVYSNSSDSSVFIEGNVVWQGSTVIPGDVNGNGTVSLGDIIYLSNWIMKGGPPPKTPLNANRQIFINTTDSGSQIIFVQRGIEP